MVLLPIAHVWLFSSRRLTSQNKLILAGEPILRETRGFDMKAGRTFKLRSKESALEYRFFQDPDLPPLILEADLVEHERTHLPELPDKVCDGGVAVVVLLSSIFSLRFS